MSEENKPGGDPEALGDAGKQALVAERKRAEDAEKALKAASVKLQQLEDAGKSELEKAQARIKELESANASLRTDLGARDLTITRLEVGIDEGLPKNLIARLQGTDADSFKSDAESLRGLIPDNTPSPFPKADPSQGPKDKTGPTSNAQAFARQLEASGL
jgi:hypothetical protein